MHDQLTGLSYAALGSGLILSVVMLLIGGFDLFGKVAIYLIPLTIAGLIGTVLVRRGRNQEGPSEPAHSPSPGDPENETSN